MVGSGSNYIPMKMLMKRKEIDLDEVSDDFHDFSLSSPARKIRRLNAQLPPIMEEEREQESMHMGSSPIFEDGVCELDSLGDPVNEERAIVLYRPLLQSSPSVTVSLDSLNLVSGFKNQILRATQSGNMNLAEDQEYQQDNNNATADKCLAVVPWVPSQFPFGSPGMDSSQTEATDLMEDDNMEAAAMDIEDNINSGIGQNQAYEFGSMRENEGLHQWPPQQHCLIPQLPQSTSTPVTWFQ